MQTITLKEIKEKKEPLLSKTRIDATIEFENATPSYKEVTTLLATNLKADAKLVVVKNIYNLFGKRTAKVIAYNYDSEDKKNIFEPKIKQKKEKKQVEKAK